MGTIYTRKRGEKWEYRFEGAQIEGKRKQISKGGFATKKEALAAGTKAMNTYNETGLAFSPTEISTADYLNQWFDLVCMPNLKYNTKIDYLQIINNHLIPRFGTYKLKALNPTIMVEWANDLKMHGYSKSHVVGIMSTFSAALTYAVEPLRYIPFNPLEYVKYPNIDKPKKEKIILQPEEWKQIIERFPFGNRFYMPLMIAYYTGMRAGEVMGLTWSRIDFEAGTITVNRQMVKRNQGNDVRKAAKAGKPRCQASQWYLATPKTKSSRRIIKIGKTLLDALKAEKRRQAENEMKYGEYYSLNYDRVVTDEKGDNIHQIITLQKSFPSKMKPLRFVCVDENGEITTPDSLKYMSRVIRHELMIAFDFHSLRHTHATILIEQGASPKSVQMRLGHSKIETTLNTYVHDTEKMQDDTVTIFESATVRAAK